MADGSRRPEAYLLTTSSSGGKSWTDGGRGGARLSRPSLAVARPSAASRPVWVFGAGHVGRAFARCWRIAVRRDLARQPVRRLPRDSANPHVAAPRLAEKVDEAPPATLFWCSRTRISSTSTSAIASCGAAFAFLGLIGSATKKAGSERLKGRGLPGDAGAAGLPDRACTNSGKQPMAIAVATAGSCWRCRRCRKSVETNNPQEATRGRVTPVPPAR
jgi:hypothetical protein